MAPPHYDLCPVRSLAMCVRPIYDTVLKIFDARFTTAYRSRDTTRARTVYEEVCRRACRDRRRRCAEKTEDTLNSEERSASQSAEYAEARRVRVLSPDEREPHQKMLGLGASMKRPLTPRLDRKRASIRPVVAS